MKLRFLKKPTIIIVVIMLVSTVAIWLYTIRDTNPVPQNIRQSLDFSPLVIPKDSKQYKTTDYKFSSGENGIKILSYIIVTNNTTITVSQYPQPPEFTDIPEYKDRFLSNVINRYETVQTSNGTIYLGRAIKQDNKQLAIMLERGLLLFMSPDQEISSSVWHKIGEQLVLQKIIE